MATMRCLSDGMSGVTRRLAGGSVTTQPDTASPGVSQPGCDVGIIKLLTSEWTLGDAPHYAGWHCSWCYPPEGIKTKLQSAQRHDQPRWGDYPDKLDLQYLAGLVRTGQWFDGTHPFISVSRRTTPAELYAPPYFLNNEDKFEYLLVPPGDQL